MAVDTPTKTSGSPPGTIWDLFVRGVIAQHPNVKTLEHLAIANPLEFRKQILEINSSSDPDALLKDIRDKHDLHGQTDHHDENTHDKTEQESSSHHPSAADTITRGVIPAVLAATRKPKFMEEDPAFWNLVEKMRDDWHEENKLDKNATNEEKLAYEENKINFEHGDLDDPESKSLQDRAKEQLKKNYASEYELDQNEEIITNKDGTPKKKSEQQQKKDAEKLKRYEENRTALTTKVFGRTVPIKFDQDHSVGATKQRITMEGNARYNLLKQKGIKGEELKQSYEAIMKRLQEKHWKQYALEHPEKTEHFVNQGYKNKNKQEQEAYNILKKQHEEVKRLQETQKAAVAEAVRITTQPVPHSSSVIPINSPPVTEPQQAPPAAQPANEITPTTASSTHAEPTEKSSSSHPEQEEKPKEHTDHEQKPIPKSPGRLARATAVASAINDPKAFAKRQAAAFTQRKIVRGIKNAGTKLLGEKGMGKVSNGMGKAGSALQALSNPKQWAQDKIKDAAMQYAKKVIVEFVKKFILTNPYFWTGVGVFLIIIIIIATIMYVITGGSQEQGTGSIAGLTLHLTGPDQVPNSQNIQYTINATYTGSADITLSDPLPADTTFVSATGNYTCTTSPCTTGTVSWKLKDNQSAPDTQTPSTKQYTLTIILHPEKNDVLIKNKIIAGGGTGGSGITLPSNPNSTDFDTLMKGQGRNTGVLGDENSFVAKVMASGVSDVQNKEDFLRKIYKVAVAKGVNPLIVVSDWALENGFATGGTAPFGCDPSGGGFPGFDANLSCSVNTWNNFMILFDTLAAKNGLPVKTEKWPPTCVYDDAFLYAAEWYGPVCHAEDGNSHFHQAFYDWYTKFLGKH